jgi:hypothetical protein
VDESKEMNVKMRWLMIVTLASLPVSARAENDSALLAKNVLIGSVSTDALGTVPPADQNWFRYQVKNGRSYCVEVDNGEVETSIRDTVVTTYHTDGATVIGTNDDIADEPAASVLSRFCYIATADEDNLAKVTAGVSGTSGTFRVRIIDTTLFCPWFFSGSGFEAFILVKNTTSTARNATVTVYNPAGTPLGTQSGVAPVNGSLNLQVSAPPPVGFGLTSAAGGVQIAHNGPPGALIANVTSLSFGSGVSFDTPASPRQDFR